MSPPENAYQSGAGCQRPPRFELGPPFWIFYFTVLFLLTKLYFYIYHIFVYFENKNRQVPDHFYDHFCVRVTSSDSIITGTQFKFHHFTPTLKLSKNTVSKIKIKNSHIHWLLIQPFQLPPACLQLASRMPSECPRNAYRMPKECLRNASRMPTECLRNASRMPSECLRNACRMPPECLQP